MYLKTITTIIILLTNGVLCYIPHEDADISQLPARTVNFPLLETSSFEKNDRSVYDPGVDIIQEQSGLDVPDSLVEQSVQSSESDDDAPLYDSGSDMNIFNKIKSDIKEDEDIALKSAVLLQMLEKSFHGGPLPLVYVEDQPKQPIETNTFDKRSGRYYRRYPWKRQNTRYKTYEADSRYLCVPSRDDVFKLLVGLHENRNGNHHKTVNFCNRKRPAKAIFTNIRFLG